MKRRLAVILGCGLMVIMSHMPALASTAEQARIEALEKQMRLLIGELDKKQQSIEALEKQVNELKGTAAGSRVNGGIESAGAEVDNQQIKEMIAEAIEEQEASSPMAKFSFGGYGELHANFREGTDDAGNSNDILDFHRLVAYVGYDFADWIKFSSELELEHSFVADDAGGEIVLEQAQVDFLLHDFANVRIGRVLTPLGIINRRHEPPSFYGVERPNFARIIIPSTWSSDGIGLFGNILPNLSYEAYVVGGLDGSGFNAINGIRGGRIKERPSLNEPAVTGRLDYFPLLNTAIPYGSNLRLGASFYTGGLDNGNRGRDPGLDDADITIYAGDFETSIARLDLRGEIAFEEIDGAEQLNGVAEEIFGYYLEAGVHVLPESFKKGLLKKADAVVFARYDNYDTQFTMPAGVPENPAGDRYDWTFGLSFYPVPNFVVKADYQILESEAEEDPDNFFNVGIGWQF